MRPARQVAALRLFPLALEDNDLHLAADTLHRLDQRDREVKADVVNFRHYVAPLADRATLDS